MIFVTVGTVMPFDRLIGAMDRWTAEQQGRPAFAQIGKGSLVPRHMSWERSLTPAAYSEVVEQSSVIVAHAGVGSYLTAATQGRPLVLLPRRKALREHTTDHQLATAHWLESREGVFIAWTEEELPERIAAALERGVIPSDFSSHASQEFTSRLRTFIAESGQ